MHQLETYSLITGALIDECFIAEEEIGLPSSKYITFHPYHSKGNARQYDSWKEVVNLLKKSCPNYEMVQIGMENDDRYEVNTSLLGKTSYNSLAYLIKNCSLHLGYDSLAVHLASHYQKKIVAIYPHWIKSSGPYFSNSEDVALFEPDFSKIKPSYSYHDPHGLVNTITPEEIANSVINLL